jgi:hypothetical protein
MGVVLSAFCKRSAARDVTKPTGGRPLGGTAFASGVVAPCTEAAERA